MNEQRPTRVRWPGLAGDPDTGDGVVLDTATPVGKLPPQTWMTAPETGRVIEALAADGAEVRFIGGCVRDALLKRPVSDIDLALAVPPERVMALLRRAGIRAVPTGLDHGTVTAIEGAMHFEITTLRRDVETDGRRARVAFTDDWQADAARRDFTFNALSCTVDGDIYDYFNGLADLAEGRVRFVGDALARIGEDVLRILRFFRFYAHFGRPPADAEALAACRQWADKLSILSGERVRIELLRTLMAPDPASVLALMTETHVLSHVLPEAATVERLRALTWLETRALARPDVRPDALRRLAAILAGDAATAIAIGGRLKLSNRQRDRLAALLAPDGAIAPETPPTALRQLLHRLGRDVARDRLLLAWASERAGGGRLAPARSQAWLDLLGAIEGWSPVAFPVRGRDVLALGVPPGRRVGELLAAVERWWREGDFRADRVACLARLTALVAENAESPPSA